MNRRRVDAAQLRTAFPPPSSIFVPLFCGLFWSLKKRLQQQRSPSGVYMLYTLEQTLVLLQLMCGIWKTFDGWQIAELKEDRQDFFFSNSTPAICIPRIGHK